MQRNTIVLQFDKAATRVAGFPYGKSIFEKQVKGKINYSEYTEIVFPDSIKRVASSFVQGFFEEIVQNIGYGGVEKLISIKTCSGELSESIKRNIR